MDSEVQSLTSTGIPSGKIGVWWFLASEIAVFGGLIASYVVVRLGSAGWSEAAAHINFRLGLVNTFILLTSSLTMVVAFRGVQDKDSKKLRTNLGLTILLGLSFLAIKAFEYAGEIGEGFTPAAGIFWSFYFGMTGLHALHVLAGIIANLILWVAASRNRLKPNEHRIELAGLYWHFVDIVWVFLFPLLYLT